MRFSIFDKYGGPPYLEALIIHAWIGWLIAVVAIRVMVRMILLVRRHCGESRAVSCSMAVIAVVNLDQLQRNRNKKRFIEIGFKSLVWFWVTFFLPIILVYYNNLIMVGQLGKLTYVSFRNWPTDIFSPGWATWKTNVSFRNWPTDIFF